MTFFGKTRLRVGAGREEGEGGEGGNKAEVKEDKAEGEGLEGEDKEEGDLEGDVIFVELVVSLLFAIFTFLKL